MLEQYKFEKEYSRANIGFDKAEKWYCIFNRYLEEDPMVISEHPETKARYYLISHKRCTAV